MISYPSYFLTPYKTIIGVIREDQIEARKAEFLHALWDVQGSLMLWLFGPPPDDWAGEDQAKRENLVELKGWLEEVLSESETPILGLNPFLIIEQVELVIRLLEELIK